MLHSTSMTLLKINTNTVLIQGHGSIVAQFVMENMIFRYVQFL